MADLQPVSDPSSSLPDSHGPDDITEALENSEGKAQGHRKRNLTNEERLEMAAFLFKSSQGEGRLPRSAITAAADKFKVHRNTASRIWNLMKPALDRGEVAEAMTVSVLSRKRGNCGRKKKDYSAEMERVKQLPADQRGSLRALSSAVGVPRTTLFRLLRDEETKSDAGDLTDSVCSVKLTITDTIKPPLSEKNKRERLRFCYSKLRPNGLFDDMFNVVHVNTKWCSLPSTLDGKKSKVMFLVAVARPQWDSERQQQFDGKLGVWPFMVADPPLPLGSYATEDTDEHRAVLRSERVFHVMETITKKEIQAMITTYVIPSIKLKMPNVLRNGPVYIQLDNQQVRLTPDDPVVAEHGSIDGWHIRLQYQPAYSPDLIVLDHHFLKNIEANVLPPHLQIAAPRLPPVEEVVSGMERSFAALPKSRITVSYLALQKTMESTMLAGGSNDYDALGDTSKRSLQLDGSVPVSVLCRPEAILACRSILSSTHD